MKRKREPIRVWRFEDAPEKLQSLSEHGGDEDWLAEIPPCLTRERIAWTRVGSDFGVCDVSEHTHPTKRGWLVKIGAHA